MTDYYFDGDNGNDTTGNGSDSLPYKSIKASTIGGVFNPANARFFIKRGTSVLLAGEIHPNASFTLTSYGDEAEPKGEVIYNSGGSYFLATGTGAASTDDIVFDSVKLTDATASSTSAVYQNDTGSGRIIVRDCEIEGFLNGIQTQRGTGHQILRNRITGVSNCGVMFEHVSVAAPSNTLCEDNYIDVTDGANDGIVYHAGTSNGTGNIARRNTIISGLEQGIDVLAMYPGTLIEHNVIYSNPSTPTLWSELYCYGADSVIRNNLIFSKNRVAIQIDGARCKVKNNVIVGTDGYAGSVQIYAIGATPVITGNYCIMPTSFASAGVLVATGITDGTAKNNIFVNYSASSTVRFISALTFANLGTWAIDNNYYVQMAGSYATPWAGNRTFAQWIATTGTPDDGTAIVATSLPLQVPTYQTIGQKFDLKKLFRVLEDNPLVEVGAHVGYQTDMAGNQFWNPPSIGPCEYVRPRTVRA